MAVAVLPGHELGDHAGVVTQHVGRSKTICVSRSPRCSLQLATLTRYATRSRAITRSMGIAVSGSRSQERKSSNQSTTRCWSATTASAHARTPPCARMWAGFNRTSADCAPTQT